jgi:hypothetical protein
VAQNVFRDPIIVSGPTRTGTGQGSLTIDRLTHFTTAQRYTVTCIAKNPDTIFSVVGEAINPGDPADGPVGIASAGVQFRDNDSKIFFTITQGSPVFEVGDKFVFEIENGTDLDQDNIDEYDEQPQKNFGAGVKGTPSGDHNLRYSDALVAARLFLQDLRFQAVAVGPNGNNITVQYLDPIPAVKATLAVQGLGYQAVTGGVAGNSITLEYTDFIPAAKAERTIQNVKYQAQTAGTGGNSISVQYTTGASGGAANVSVVGNAITVQIQSGVTTANTIISAVNAHGAAFALVQASLSGSNLAQTAPVAAGNLTGGAAAIGDAGNEVVTVVGTAITVRLQVGVSTATQVAAKITASAPASALVTVSVTAGSTVQSSLATTPLAGGVDAIGESAPAVQVTSNLIQVYFRTGVHTASAIASAITAFPAAAALVTATATADVPQYAPVAATALSGGRARYYSLNQHELTDVPNFFEGNASVRANDVTAQGRLDVTKDVTVGEKLSLRGTSGPQIADAQRAINDLFEYGKLRVSCDNDAPVLWIGGVLTFNDVLRFTFPTYGFENTVAATTYSPTDGQSVYLHLNPYQTKVLTASVGAVPAAPNAFRLVTRVASNLVWFNGAVQKEGDTTRVGAQVDFRAQVLGLLTGGGTVSHSPTTPGLITWSSAIVVKQIGRSEQVTINASNITLADGEVAYVEVTDPWTTATRTMQKAAISTAELMRPDRFWIFHRSGTTIHTRNGGTLIQGEEATLGTEISSDLYTYIGSAGETDNDPAYTTADGGTVANRFVTEGDNLTKSIKRLDTRAGVQQDLANQDRVARVIHGGTWSWNQSTGAVTRSTDAYVAVDGLPYVRNTITSATAITLSTNNQVAYVTLNRTGTSAASLTVTVVAESSLPVGDNIVVIARRINNVLIVNNDSFIDGESRILGASISTQTASYIGTPNQADATPSYNDADGSSTTNRFVTDGDSLTKSIKRLDTRAGVQQDIANHDRNYRLLAGGAWAWNSTTGVLSWSADAYITNTIDGDARNTILAGSVTLADGQVAYVDVLRTFGSVTNLTPTVITSGSSFVPADNRFVFARRRGSLVYVGLNAAAMVLSNGESRSFLGQAVSDQVLGYIGSPGVNDSTPDYTSNRYVADNQSLTAAINVLDAQAGAERDISNQDRTMRLIGGGTWSWNGTAITWSAQANVRVPGLADSANVLPAQSTSVADGAVLYADINRAGPGGTITVATVAVASYVPADSRVIIGTRSGSTFYMANTAFVANEAKALDSVSDRLLTYVGSPDAGDSTPDYSSTNHIADGDSLTVAAGKLDAALQAHLADAVDAHDASAISNVPSGNLAATDVQGALNELQTDIDTRATTTALNAHINDTTDAHMASSIGNTPSGNLAATTVQAALNELQTDVDTRTQAASTAPASVGTANTVGVGTTAARADHVHQGVHSLAKNGSSQLFGDVTLSGTGGTALTQAGQDIQIDSPALASAVAASVGSANAVGVGTTSARADHVHQGVHSVKKQGDTALYGDVEFVAGSNVSLTQTGNVITIAATGGGGSSAGIASGGALVPGAYPYTIQSADIGTVIMVDTSTAKTLVLPTPAAGFVITIKDKTGSAATNPITLQRAGGEKIEGLAVDVELRTGWGSWNYFSDGTDWFRI